jgi:hypothetical protein
MRSICTSWSEIQHQHRTSCLVLALAPTLPQPGLIMPLIWSLKPRVPLPTSTAYAASKWRALSSKLQSWWLLHPKCTATRLNDNTRCTILHILMPPSCPVTIDLDTATMRNSLNFVESWVKGKCNQQIAWDKYTTSSLPNFLQSN